MLVGVPASGKTWLAKDLADKIINSAYISKDLIQTPFTDSERVSGSIYSMIQGPTFRILVDFADVQLSLGKTPIIDAPFSINHWRNDEYRDWVSAFRGVAKRYGARLAIVRCVPPNADILKARIEARWKRKEAPWDRWKLDHWSEFLEQEPIDFPILHDDIFEFISDERVKQRAEEILIYHLHAEEFAEP